MIFTLLKYVVAKIAIHPSGKYVTLAIEPRFRVCDIFLIFEIIVILSFACI
jgi:hypothetical protein